MQHIQIPRSFSKVSNTKSHRSFNLFKMTTIFSLISSNFFKKSSINPLIFPTIPKPNFAIPQFGKQPQSFSAFPVAGQAHDPTYVPGKSPPEIPTAPPWHNPGLPPEVPQRPNIPEFDPIPPEKPIDPPPTAPGPSPEFPGPPDPIPPKPEPEWAPKEPEAVPPSGPDIEPPRPPEFSPSN
ncbi:hypothetical protein ACS0TY_027405 [Phlomoides rotata]